MLNFFLTPFSPDFSDFSSIISISWHFKLFFKRKIKITFSMILRIIVNFGLIMMRKTADSSSSMMGFGGIFNGYFLILCINAKILLHTNYANYQVSYRFWQESFFNRNILPLFIRTRFPTFYWVRSFHWTIFATPFYWDKLPFVWIAKKDYLIL